MRYQSLSIENFRGIINLEITDMKRVNLLVGRNNCGKTSVLEAVFLLSGMSNPQLPINIHNFRDLVLASDEDFSYMFRNLDFSVPISIMGNIDNCKRNLSITPLYVDYSPQQSKKSKQKEIINQQENITVSTSFARLVEGINLVFKNHQNQKFQGQISLKESKMLVADNYKEDLKCSYLNPKTIMVQIDKRMEGLLIQKKLDTVISVLKNIEPKVMDIRMGANGMIYVDVGANNLLPLNIMGDGMRLILAMMAAIADMKNGVLLVDEIENGLHYTSLSVMWKAIFAACKEYNVQLIATTHSYECIEAFSNVYDKIESEGDTIRLYRIDKEEEKHKAFIYAPQVLKVGIEKEFEVR
ncbi:MAG: AAA family ATPase [Candidatus Desantisbacteria bacterium]